MIKLSRSQQIALVVVLAVVTVALVAYAVRSGGTSRPESAGATGPTGASARRTA